MLCQAEDAAVLATLATDLHRVRAGYGGGQADDRYLLAAYLASARQVRFAEARGAAAWAWDA